MTTNLDSGRPAGPPTSATTDGYRSGLAAVWAALEGDRDALERVQVTGPGALLPSPYAVTDLAAASIGAALLATSELAVARSGAIRSDRVTVDRVVVGRVEAAAVFALERHARPIGWTFPPVWDPLAGDYRTADGWIRLHTNYVHHRDPVLAVLAPATADRHGVAAAVSGWMADDLESAVVAAGGCAAALRTPDAWAVHPQGVAVAAEPVVAVEVARTAGSPSVWWTAPGPAPLAGVRVLDLTRVIAGPVATGFLAAHGADVVRVDPVGFDEVPILEPLMKTGKRCRRLDLTDPRDRDRFDELVAGADVVVHGYRQGALAGLGYATDRLRAINPRLVEVGHDAYGWTGPWAGRRGFDSLVQMSTGIAERGRRVAHAGLSSDEQAERPPGPLPVQALDHATGYLVAAAVVRGLTRLLTKGEVTTNRLSLAATAGLLTGFGVAGTTVGRALTEDERDGTLTRLDTDWGPIERPRWPGTAPVAA